MDFKGVLEKIDELDLMVIPYENATGYGIRAMVNSIENKESIKNVGIMVGPEGGFEESEIEALKEKRSSYCNFRTKNFKNRDSRIYLYFSYSV